MLRSVMCGVGKKQIQSFLSLNGEPSAALQRTLVLADVRIIELLNSNSEILCR